MRTTLIRRHQIQITCMTLLSILANASVSAEPTISDRGESQIAQTPFEVSYQARLMGTKLTATSTLQPIEDGQFEYHYNTSSILGKATEMSRYALADTTTLIPLFYRYKLSAMGVKRRINLAFDWQTGSVTDRAAKPQWSLELPPGALDPLSMQLQLRNDVMRGKTDLTYQVTRNGRIKEYHYLVETQEITETLIGPLRTVRVRRDRGDDSDKHTVIWLAVDWSYLIAKIQDGKVDGGVQEVVLAGGSIGGATITALDR